MKHAFGAMASPGETIIPCETRCETVIIGPAFVLSDTLTEPSAEIIPEERRAAEIASFREALVRSAHVYEQRMEHAKTALPVEIADEAESMLMAEAMLLNDKGAHKKIETAIGGGKSAARAAYDSFTAVSNMMRQSQNTKMQGISHAIESALLVLLQELGHNAGGATLADAPDGSIPVTPTLPVGMTSYLRNADGARILGMLNSSGTDEDHTNIIARALGVGIARLGKDELERIENDDVVIIDGPGKKIVFNPAPATLDTYTRKSQADATAQQTLIQKSQADNGIVRTRNGNDFKISANISYSDEVRGINSVHAAGIGLYRTELAVQRANSAITEDKWHRIFSDIVSRTERGKAIIRTIDLDGDKANDSYDEKAVEGIIQRQMKAALNVAQEIGSERVGVMIPLVTSAAHLAQFQEQMNALAAEAGLPTIKLGAMVETTEFITDLQKADAAFFSIGTNDLIADIIGFNRFDREERNRLHDPTDPRVLAAIAKTAEAGDKKGIPVSVCGDLGSDPRYFALLSGAGIRSVSSGANAVPVMKEVARRIDTAAAKKLFDAVIGTADRTERMRLLDEFNARELGLHNRSLDSGWTSGMPAGPATPQP